MASELVKEKALELASAGHGLPAYIYDLPALRSHADIVQAAMAGSGTELFYAAKANPAPELLHALHPYMAGYEVASGGEAEVNAAVEAAKRAFPKWAGMPAPQPLAIER